MNAIISGRAGLAVLLDGGSLFSLTVAEPREPRPRRPAEVRLMLQSASDASVFEGITLEEARRQLSLLADCSDALDLALIILDKDISDGVRDGAAHVLDGMLADAAVAEHVENVLYSHELSASADFGGASARAERFQALGPLLRKLVEHQASIRDVRRAWEAAAEPLAAERRDELRLTAVRAGAFRLLAEAHLKRGGFTVESAPQTVAALASLRDNKVSSRWIELAGVSLTKGGEACENCGSPMVIKLGRFGQFLACSTYPECRTTREMPAPNPAEAGAAAGAPPAEALCELCGKPMVEKRGRFGLFLGCTGYPECRNIRGASKKAGGVAPAPVPIAGETCPLDGSGLVRRQSPYGEIVSCARHPVCKYVKRETTGVACPRPGCGGEVLVKKSKRGKYFYGCSEYPKCDTVYWDKPVAVPCPRCNAPFLLEKTKGGSVVRRCAREDCRYESGRLGTASANRESRVGSDGGDARRPYH